MKLYLSSFRLGDHPEHWVDLLPPSPRVAVICNAIDTEDPVVRQEKVAAEIGWLTDLGMTADELDLRTLVGGQTGGVPRARQSGVSGEPAAGALDGYDGVWVRGGNVFVLRAAMAVSGVDQILPGLIRSEQLVYAGYSAGACLLAPSLRGLELCDDPGTGGVIWEGLNVLDEAFVPHLDSPGHPETDLVAQVANHYDRTGVRYLGLRDGQALVIDGDRRELR